jgi:hypothetical protein
VKRAVSIGLKNDTTMTIRDDGAISLDLVNFVPQADGRLGGIVVLVVQDAEARGSEQEVPAGGRFEAEPAGAEDAQDMAARSPEYLHP